ncbi:hypothetical protein GCM10011487_08250 [Steroidobacter agaridevorans]|uniref:Ice-binding protein C-terminal domain-containing protein n=1 Tax=Steroidobacter agaridevorans TaxID=2695856 RepID=A0A829Y739_9GAMM|nr:PEP-CTERM sorting domain-containing protein [Steroidobacter agaridevorans]GFE78825.1 hypothetical protein GCM10011487_08250 [Steroidobacter agaridevorans]GFE87980.1 hypothetical protein GCM10011488_29340 [Steroidobacter agaridevorans]
MNKKVLAALSAGLVALPLAANAVPVSFGALSSDDDGSTAIITDSLNNYEWLRWDVLGDLTYAETLAAISSGGQYEGWQFARNGEAQLFTNALLQGLTNACTAVGSDTCNSTLPNVLTDLLGNSGPGGLSNMVGFLSEDNVQAGFLQYTHEGDLGGLFKANDVADVALMDAAENVGWLLYRAGGNVPPQTNVPEPGSLALFAVGMAGIGAMRRRRRA